MDDITLERVHSLHPKLEGEAIAIIMDVNAKRLLGPSRLRCTCALRSPATQDQLYSQGRTAPGKVVTWAKGWQSYHQYGLAMDLVLLIDRNLDGKFEEASYDQIVDMDKDMLPDWLEMLNAFRERGWECGADWKAHRESPHVQKTYGLSWKELYALVKAKQVDQNGYVLIH